MEVAQVCAWLQSQLVTEQRSVFLVLLKRLGVTVCVVERQHQEPSGTLAIRVQESMSARASLATNS